MTPFVEELITLYQHMEYNFQEFSDYIDAYCNKYLDENQKKIVDDIINKYIKSGIFVSGSFISEDDKNENLVSENYDNQKDMDEDDYDDLDECIMTVGKLQKVVAQLKTTVEVVE